MSDNVESSPISHDLALLGKQAIADLYTNLTQAKGFILEQAPDFCQQLVRRDITLAIFAATIALVAAALFAVLSVKSIRRIYDGHDDPGSFIGAVFGSVLACSLAVVWIINCYTAIYIASAPKVYLVEQLMKLVK